MPTLVRRTPVQVRLAPALESAVAEVFESMAFVEAFRRLPAPPFAPEEPLYCTRLPVFQPHAGVVSLTVPHSLALALSAAMVGRTLDPEADECLIMDVLGELANMLAGSLLTRLLPEVDGFELGLPEVRLVSDLATEPTAPADTTLQFTAHGATFLAAWECSCKNC